MEAMWARFLPHMREIRAAARRRRARRDRRRSSPTTASGSRRTATHRLFAPELGGGALLDLGIYPVSFASMVLGRAEPRGRARRPRVHRRRRPDLDPARLRERRPRRAQLHAARRSARRAPRSSAPRRGSRSTARSTRRSSFTLIPREGEPQRVFDPPAEGGLRHEADEVARCLRGGRAREPGDAARRDRRDHADDGRRSVRSSFCLTTLPIALRGSSSRKRTSRGRLWGASSPATWSISVLLVRRCRPRAPPRR